MSISVRSTMAQKSVRRNCSGETLTDTVSCGQALPSRQARRSTQAPSSMISPECSAMAMNSVGGMSPRTGWRPAAQRFDPEHASRRSCRRSAGRARRRPVVLDRLAQIGFQELALGEVGVHRRVVDAGAVAALVLGAVERHVGVAHDVGGAGAVLVDHGDADRGADDDVVAADGIGRADGGDQALGERHHLGGVVAQRGDHRELVAAEPRHQVVAAQRVRQPQRDVADQFVADVMAERVVDVLEVVEIDIEHRGRACGRRAPRRSPPPAAR